MSTTSQSLLYSSRLAVGSIGGEGWYARGDVYPTVRFFCPPPPPGGKEGGWTAVVFLLGRLSSSLSGTTALPKHINPLCVSRSALFGFSLIGIRRSVLKRQCHDAFGPFLWKKCILGPPLEQANTI